MKKYNDSALREIIHKEYDTDKLIKLPTEERNKMIKEIYNKTDVSIRQLSRILGIGKTTIEKAIK